MTAERFHLDYPPIVEAIVDIVCDLPPGLDLASLQERAKELLQDRYPITRSTIQRLDVQVKFVGEHAMQQEIGGLQFLTPDEKQIVQIRSEGYAFNRLAPYSSLDVYLPEIERTWAVFREVVQPVQIRRIGLRYINRFLLPETVDDLDVTEYLHVSPPAEDESLQSIGFLHQHVAVELATENAVTVTLLSQPPEAGRLPIILDIDTIDARTRPTEDWPAIEEAVAALRRLKNRVFERTLTEQCLNLFRQP